MTHISVEQDCASLALSNAMEFLLADTLFFSVCLLSTDQTLFIGLTELGGLKGCLDMHLCRPKM